MKYYIKDIDSICVRNNIIYNGKNCSKEEGKIYFNPDEEYTAEVVKDEFCLSRNDVLEFMRAGLFTKEKETAQEQENRLQPSNPKINSKDEKGK